MEANLGKIHAGLDSRLEYLRVIIAGDDSNGAGRTARAQNKRPRDIGAARTSIENRTAAAVRNPVDVPNESHGASEQTIQTGQHPEAPPKVGGVQPVPFNAFRRPATRKRRQELHRNRAPSAAKPGPKAAITAKSPGRGRPDDITFSRTNITVAEERLP